MSGQARLGREFVSYEPNEENKLTDLLQAASALRGDASLPPCDEYFQGPQTEFGALAETILVFKYWKRESMLPLAYAPLHRNSLKMSLWLSSWCGKPSIHPARLELSSLPSRCRQDRGLPPVQVGDARPKEQACHAPSPACTALI